MKKMLIFLGLLFPLVAAAQSNLEIHSVKGEVQLKRSGEKTFRKVHQLDEVRLDDVIRICKECQVSIADLARGSVYSLDKIGEWKIGHLLDEENRDRSSGFAKRCVRLFEALDKGDARYSELGVKFGAAIRGEGVDLYDSIYAKLAQGTFDDLNALPHISVVKSVNPDGSFSISVTNLGAKVLFCNVLLVSEQWVPAVCYYTESFANMIPLLPNIGVDFADMPLDANAGTYYLLITEENISIRHLSTTLEGEPKTIEEPSDRIKLIGL